MASKAVRLFDNMDGTFPIPPIFKGPGFELCGYSREGSRGWIIAPGDTLRIATGVKCNIPEDHFVQIYGTLKYMGRAMCFISGVVDKISGEIFIITTNIGVKNALIMADRPFAQIIFIPYMKPREKIFIDASSFIEKERYNTEVDNKKFHDQLIGIILDKIKENL